MYTTQIFLLCLVFVGVIAAKTHIMDEYARSSMTNLVLCVFLPCNILSAFFGTSRSQLPSLGIMLVISIGIIMLCFLLSRYVLYRGVVNPEQKKVLIYGTIVSNAVFLGNPVVESIYGLGGLTYVAAYLVPLRISVWTLGLAVFTGGKGSLKKVIFHPGLIATYIGFLIMITGFTPPALVSRLVFSLGNCTTPLSLIVIGGILASVDPRKIFTKLTVYFAFIRLVLVPFLVMGILFITRPAPMVSGISVILSGMPAGVTTSLLAGKFGADKELSSKIIFMSTLLSLITIPFLVWLLQKALY